MLKYHVIAPVWGGSYIDVFLHVSLPTQLSPGNLPGIAGLDRIKYRVYTRPGDGDRIRSSHMLAQVRRLVDTEVIEATDVEFDAVHHYQPFSECYRLGMRQADLERAGCVFLTADQVWADGSIANIIDLGDKGKRAVLISGPRVVEETFVPLFLKTFSVGEDPCVTLDPRKAVKLALEHLHPWDRSLFWDQENTGRPASFMFWPVSDDGFLMRCFHLHPILVNPKDGYSGFRPTIDGSDFVRRVCQDLRDLHVVQDSDEVMYFSIAPAAQSAELIDRPKTDWRGVLRWAKVSKLSKHNLHYLQKPIRFHVGEISDQWEDAERISDAVVRPVIKDLDNEFRLALYKFVTRLHTIVIPRLRLVPVLYRIYQHIAGLVKSKVLG